MFYYRKFNLELLFQRLGTLFIQLDFGVAMFGAVPNLLHYVRILLAAAIDL